MPDIFHNFAVRGSLQQVFDAIATPTGLDSWWAKSSAGGPVLGTEYQLGFGQGYEWRAVVSRSNPPREFELQLTAADADWQGSRLIFVLEETDSSVHVEFKHTGWPEENDHYRTTCYCWAMYLRLLKRYVEFGEVVPYEDRLDV